MSSAKIAISLDPEALKQVDQLVEGGLFPSRSKLIQDAVAEKLRRLRRVRLAQECAKLHPLTSGPRLKNAWVARPNGPNTEGRHRLG